MNLDDSKPVKDHHEQQEHFSCGDSVSPNETSANHDCSDQECCCSSSDSLADEAVPLTETTDKASDQETDLQTKLDEAHKRIAELKDSLLRARAELENQRKIQQRELEKAHKFAIDKLVRELIPIKDSLDIGVTAGQANPANGEAILEGLELIQKMLAQVLTNQKVKQISPIGEKFDPNLHEALSMLNSDEFEANEIMNVFQSGYVLNGRPIRPARVIVSRGPTTTCSDELARE